MPQTVGGLLSYDGSETIEELERRIEGLASSDPLVGQVFNVARVCAGRPYDRMLLGAYFSLQRYKALFDMTMAMLERCLPEPI